MQILFEAIFRLKSVLLLNSSTVFAIVLDFFVWISRNDIAVYRIIMPYLL